jgi:adenylate cyclase class 2
MQYEVEQKFPVADMPRFEDRLAAMGGAASSPRLEVDQYYAHPARDFAATDEALRIRQVGTSAYITYKGPKIDATTKTRRELELPLETRGLAGWAELLDALGFRPVAVVRKQRRKAQVSWQGRHVEVSLDDVEGVGQYVELELMAPSDGVEAARRCLADLAAQLGLAASERRSYLELLLIHRAATKL